jgi:hypothetical protein
VSGSPQGFGFSSFFSQCYQIGLCLAILVAGIFSAITKSLMDKKDSFEQIYLQDFTTFLWVENALYNMVEFVRA